VQYTLKRADDEFPLDLAFDGAAGFTIADNITVFEIGPQLHYSHRFPLEGSAGALSPYGSLFLDINHVSIDLPPATGNNASDTDVDLVARFGLEWEATRKFMWMGELEVGRGTNFSTGVNIPF
jgi:hypothetical protein